VPTTKSATDRAPRSAAARRSSRARGADKCRRKFLRVFPGGFAGEKYIDWERDYKWAAHLNWRESLPEAEFRGLMEDGEFSHIAEQAVRIESRTNLLFSFEKMALRDAVRSRAGARTFSEGLFDLLHGPGAMTTRFEGWCEAIASLPRKQTRVLTWPLATVFGFLAQPRTHFFLKPRVTQRAFEEYGLDFAYRSRPNAETYSHLLELARTVRRDLADLKPRDLIDVQSFLWVQGSDEYEEYSCFGSPRTGTSLA
jgi:hypothetical protein